MNQRHSQSTLRRLLDERRRRTIMVRRHVVDVRRERGPADSIDLANAQLDQETYTEVTSLLSEALGDVDEALRRVEAGTYGTCATCGRTIPRARLRAVPSASLCTRCKEREERLDGRRRVALPPRWDSVNWDDEAPTPLDGGARAVSQ